MRKLFIFVIFLILITASCQNQAAESDEVRAAYEKYKNAILQDKGEESIKYLDSRTLKYYAGLLEKVKKADENTVKSLPFMDKFQILRIRLAAKKEQILSFDEKSLLVFAVKNGMVGKESVVNNTVGEVTIDNNFAKGQMLVKNQKTPFFLSFYKENDQWKIDLTSVFPTSSQAFKKLIDESGMNENDYLIKVLEAASKKKIGKEIWIPTEKLD